MHPLFKMLAMNVDKKLHKSNFLVCNTKAPLYLCASPDVCFRPDEHNFHPFQQLRAEEEFPTNFTWMPTRLNEIRV